MTDLVSPASHQPAASAATAGQQPVVETSAWHFSKRRRVPWISLGILVLVLIAAVVGGGVTGHNPREGDISAFLKPPFWLSGGSTEHLLGTDQLGRDVLSRILGGARLTLLVALAGVFFSGAIGSVIGIVSGFAGGWVDSVFMRLTDIVLAVPILILGLAFGTLLGPGVRNVIIVLAALTWAYFARVIRSEVLKLRETDYVLAARLAGTSTFGILRRHILPNVMNSIVVVATLQIGNTIIIAASLSFLGLGIPQPNPEWGLMLADAKNYLRLAWWLTVFPGIALAATVLAANLFGDWLRDTIDPNLGS
jgi:peptide/nickel transport system permease protein